MIKRFFPKKRKGFLVLAIFLLTTLVSFLVFSPQDELVLPVPETTHDFSLIVLPDTQYYSKDHPKIFKTQTQWIVDNLKEKKIVFVSHLGDITETENEKKEWQNANSAISLLDGIVPYGLLPGNHDDPKMFNQFFSYSRYQKEAWWGGHYGQTNNNNYQFFSAGGMDFIIFHLGDNPSDSVLNWADEILKTHQTFRAIVVTHYALDFDGFRSPMGQRIFKALSDNPNLFLILSGHIPNEAKKTDFLDSRLLYQLLANYQARPNGGDGWLRILKFVPLEDKIYVQTYSPYLDQYEVDENSQFELDYEMSEDG